MSYHLAEKVPNKYRLHTVREAKKVGKRTRLLAKMYGVKIYVKKRARKELSR